MSAEIPADETPQLIQHIIVLDYVAKDDDLALFCSEIPDGREPTKLLLRLETYEDMKKPEQLSVAIRPGNCFVDADMEFQTPPGAV